MSASPMAEHRVVGGRYELRRRIGAGGMSDVFRATDRVLGRDVALKLLAQRLASDPAFVERFKREARAAAALNHPNIVAVYDWGADSGTYFMVMELVEGETLKELVDRAGALPEREAVEIASQVASALDAAHRQGVIHRDVKPHNVLLAAGRQVKVADFGIARALGASQLTDTTMVFGTAQYISPEQAQGDPADARSDVYGLGVLLYEMLSGHVPFDGDAPLSVAWQHVNKFPPPLRSGVPPVSAAVEAVVLRALAKSPAERFQSALDMRTALEDALALTGPPGAARAEAVTPDAATQLVVTVPPGRPVAHALPEPPAPVTRVAAALPATSAPRHPESRERREGGGALRLAGVLGAAFVSLIVGVLLMRRVVATDARQTEVLGAQASSPTSAAGAAPQPAATQLRATEPPPTAAAPTAVPATPVPQPPAPAAAVPQPAPTAPESAGAVYGDPAQAVIGFYTLVAEHRFGEAATLWSPAMQAGYPSAENIDQRFAATRGITVNRAVTTARDDASGTAVVVVDLDEVTGTPAVTHHFSGTWYLVRGSRGWLLNQPSF